jgi:hypothetical protein
MSVPWSGEGLPSYEYNKWFSCLWGRFCVSNRDFSRNPFSLFCFPLYYWSRLLHRGLHRLLTSVPAKREEKTADDNDPVFPCRTTCSFASNQRYSQTSDGTSAEGFAHYVNRVKNNINPYFRVDHLKRLNSTFSMPPLLVLSLLQPQRTSTSILTENGRRSRQEYHNA